ncbi:D-alanine--D-alanine ligase [Paenibacillus chondroitinus]|uniref:D-alanine--D-alanine ligase n=1 Tax=Paenibacillus chondroitinus TaxID=59842 RepID=A0ABU6DGQ1_9BACL|nr:MULTISPECIES: D-alanine--D-alanine ligase [Paenibacillus]MCY9659552.1 D-alanine--D-alanine ligase [Paenibacillus anseongense]MEB4796947.1 D-alanine--D-alanine ligase [Paenibacillus chondroitinus]
MSGKIRVGLIYGGKSGEHDVSLQTAMAVMKAVDFTKYEVVPFYISKKGEWKSGAPLLAPVASKEELTFSSGDSANAPVSNALAPIFGAVHAKGDVAISSAAAAGTKEANIDVVFPLLHGTFGEDGTIQGLLEMANIPYVGAGVLASAVGMDKVMMKKIFAQEGLPQCIFRHFTRTEWEKNRAYHLIELETAIGYPCFVKPANLGSSVGISKARNQEELLQAVSFAFQYDRKVIIEENIDAREIEVAVLGNDEPQASVVGEIVSSNEFYDYKAKYVDGKSAMVIPAEIPAETAEQVRQLAVQAFLAVDGSGLSRVDFFLGKADQKIYINEINTMPGFTPYSMYPLLWQESGKPYTELLDDLIRLAVERHTAKQSIQYSFDVE